MKILNFRRWAILLSMVAITSCTSAPQKNITTTSASDINKLLSGEKILGREVFLSELPNEDLFALTPEMIAFADAATEFAETPLDKALNLHKALIKSQSEGGRGIKVDAKITENSLNTFSHRSANCLSFSLLFVAMARHLNLDAYINEVDIPPSWDMLKDNSMYFMRHVNVIVRFPITRGIVSTNYVVVDLVMDQYRPSFAQRELSPALIEAQYYSNRATEMMAEGKSTEAFLNLRRALAVDNKPSYIWNNLAILYRRANLPYDAEQAYLQGLAVNKNDVTIMNNLEALYRSLNQSEKADHFNRVARSYRHLNPYQQYSLAAASLRAGDAKMALIRIQEALAKEPEEPRFYHLASAIYKALNEEPASVAMQKKYEKLVARERG